MKTKLITASAIAIVFSILFWGCATIMHGSSQKVGISSSPTGAKVTVDGKILGDAPLFANLGRGDEHIITLELPGYQKSQFTITKSVSGWVWGNIIFGGLIGLAIDAVSGGLYDLSPEQINAELKKDGITAIQQKDGVYILSVMSPNPNWKKIGNLNPVQ
ncbi:MAG: PEGA domain-containing protein [Bacteroidetes bacterium]|nr:PEGA domain-containing protein [Bacteroidota bacterium]